MHHSTDSKRSGFAPGILLLDVVLALTIAVLVLSGVFAIAAGSLSMSESISEEGRMQISQETFLTFLERNFESLPGNAVMEVEFEERGQRYVYDLTFQNVPVTFAWAGQSVSPEAVRLSAVPRVDNTLDIVLRYYDEPILDETAESEDLQPDPVTELVLMRNVWQFEWEVLDARTMEWDYQWDMRGRRPLQLKLVARFHPEGELVEHFFWIPPKVDPKTIINSNTRLQGRGQGTGQQPPTNTPGRPTTDPRSNPPTNTPTPRVVPPGGGR